MSLSEEKELKSINKEYAQAMEVFRKKEFKKAFELFDKIIEKYKDSESYGVQEYIGKSRVYYSVCDSKLNPIKIELTSDEDYLNEGIFNLNKGDFEKAIEYLTKVKNKKGKKAFVNYLLSIIYNKREDPEKSLDFLKKAIEEDDFYKILAYNESDFENLKENEDFLALVKDEF